MAEQQTPDKLRMAAEFDVTAPPAQEPPKAADQPPQKFTREITVGGRVQKFEADTYEALVDKLVEAQTNATQKLQELSQQQPKPRREPESRSSDWQEVKPQVLKAEDVVQLEKNPHELFRRLYQSEFGMTPEEARQMENQRRQQQAEMAAQNEFIRKHPDFSNTPQNAQKMFSFLAQQNLPVSRRNLDYAFEELRSELMPQSAPLPPARRNDQPPESTRPQSENSTPPSFLRPSLGGRGEEPTGGGNDAAEIARIAQLPPAEMKARIEQIFRQSRSSR